MSLKQVQAFDVLAYSQAILSASGLGTNGCMFGVFAQQSFGWGTVIWLQARDRLYVVGRGSSPTPTRLLFAFDPDFVFTAAPGAQAVSLGSDDMKRMFPGCFNPATGQQKLYGVVSGPLREINVDTLAFSAGAAFPTANGDFILDSSDVGSGSEGGWTTPTAVRALIFEGLTAGIPGETVLTGTGVYPKGLAWMQYQSATLNGTSLADGFGWMDLNTRRIVGRPGGLTPTKFPALVTSSPSATQDQSEAPFGADNFTWGPLAFVQDEDATFNQPKGELVFILREDVQSIGTPSPGDHLRCYVRWTDFNPFGLPSAAGVAERTHGRIRLTSRMHIPLRPMFDIVGSDYWNAPQDMCAAWDPLRRRLVQFAHRTLTPPFSTGQNAVAFYSRAVDPVIVSAPAARSVPRTGDVVDYESFVGGDLAEPAAGQNVTFTLARRSTRGELLAISGGAGTTSTVAHPAIDTDAAGVADLALVADGVALALTTDYTVVAATGVITWVTSQAGKTVLATYKHRNTDAQPAHGTLLLAAAQADENGSVRTQVAYPDDDDLVGEIDALTAALA